MYYLCLSHLLKTANLPTFLVKTTLFSAHEMKFREAVQCGNRPFRAVAEQQRVPEASVC